MPKAQVITLQVDRKVLEMRLLTWPEGSALLAADLDRRNQQKESRIFKWNKRTGEVKRFRSGETGFSTS